MKSIVPPLHFHLLVVGEVALVNVAPGKADTLPLGYLRTAQKALCKFRLLCPALSDTITINLD